MSDVSFYIKMHKKMQNYINDNTSLFGRFAEYICEFGEKMDGMTCKVTLYSDEELQYLRCNYWMCLLEIEDEIARREKKC